MPETQAEYLPAGLLPLPADGSKHTPGCCRPMHMLGSIHPCRSPPPARCLGGAGPTLRLAAGACLRTTSRRCPTWRRSAGGMGGASIDV